MDAGTYRHGELQLGGGEQISCVCTYYAEERGAGKPTEGLDIGGEGAGEEPEQTAGEGVEVDWAATVELAQVSN